MAYLYWYRYATAHTRHQSSHVLTRVTNRLHLVDVITVDDVIEADVKFVEQSHHLEGRTAATQRRETHDVAEVNRAHVERLRPNCLTLS